VSDKDGNIVSYTYTIESWGGSGIVVPGYGFLLNNEMTDFDFSGPAPNVPEAGKRPRSSMSPTIAFKNGKPAFSIGSPAAPPSSPRCCKPSSTTWTSACRCRSGECAAPVRA
jgi:gamma-glutamyltranspeptidase